MSTRRHELQTLSHCHELRTLPPVSTGACASSNLTDGSLSLGSPPVSPPPPHPLSTDSIPELNLHSPPPADAAAMAANTDAVAAAKFIRGGIGPFHSFTARMAGSPASASQREADADYASSIDRLEKAEEQQALSALSRSCTEQALSVTAV